MQALKHSTYVMYLITTDQSQSICTTVTLGIEWLSTNQKVRFWIPQVELFLCWWAEDTKSCIVLFVLSGVCMINAVNV